MNNLQKIKLKDLISFKQIIFMLLSVIGYSLALNMFYVGNEIAAGGVAGIATILNAVVPIPIGVMMLIMNIPILIWAIFVKGKYYTIMTLIATVLYSAVVDLTAFLPTVTDDKLVAVVCGGILYGVSASMAVKGKVSLGGTDLLAKMLITKFQSISLGQLLMCIDGTVVVLSIICYHNIEAGIFAILAIATCSLVTDKLNQLFSKANVFYIFANQNRDLICNEIMHNMGRGVTGIPAVGKYAESEREILMVIVTPQEVPKVKQIVHKYDPTAFVALSQADEIMGEGFETLDLTSTVKDK